MKIRNVKGENVISPDWIRSGDRNRNIHFDINSTPLQIQTDSEIGSGEVMWVQFLANSRGTGISVRFDKTPNYHIGGCETVKDRPEIPLDKLGEKNDRVWTIEMVNSQVRLNCNGEEIFDFDPQSTNDGNCKDRWSLDFNVLKFVDNSWNNGTKDTASDFYREHTSGNDRQAG